MKMPPVEIQWCDHSSVLLEYLRQLYEEGRFVDVGLECEGRQVKAHKAVISACSPYLEGLLKGNPARSHLIKFNGYSYSSLKAVIDFMYNGKVMVEQDNLAAFLKLGRALQVRGILDIAAQCEEAGLTTPEETKTNAQYSTTVQQSQKNAHQKHQQNLEGKKYAFLMDKNQKKGAQRKQQPNIIGSVDQQQNINKVTAAHAAQQQVTEQQQILQQQQQPSNNQATDNSTTLEELQAALASGNALIQASDPNGGGEQTLQMMEGQCVVTGSGQTYVVVQEGENLSFVPAEMVQGDLQAAVNGGQVLESLENVDEQFAAQMQGQVLNHDVQQALQHSGVQEDTGSSDTMSVVESLVKLGQKQPNEGETLIQEDTPEVGPDMPDLGGDTADEEAAVDEPEPMDDDSIDKKGAKRSAELDDDQSEKKLKL